MKHMTLIGPRFGALLLMSLLLALSLSTVASADTDGTEPQITQQPDQLILQLGVRWAGVEFELRTDAGVFPAPVVVDENGVLTMDLGGSTTYTLSCIDSTVPIPDPAQPSDPTQEAITAPDAQDQTTQPSGSDPGSNGIPIVPLVVFLIGLAFAVGALVALWLTKKRQQAVYDEWAEDDEEDDL